jgi:hypothetical protein
VVGEAGAGHRDVEQVGGKGITDRSVFALGTGGKRPDLESAPISLGPLGNAARGRPQFSGLDQKAPIDLRRRNEDDEYEQLAGTVLRAEGRLRVYKP